MPRSLPEKAMLRAPHRLMITISTRTATHQGTVSPNFASAPAKKIPKSA